MTIEQKYQALFSPHRLFKDEAAVRDFLDDADEQEVKDFIEVCVSEESYMLASYANKLLNNNVRDWRFVDFEDAESRKEWLKDVPKANRDTVERLMFEANVIQAEIDKINDTYDELDKELSYLCQQIEHLSHEQE
jgi:hypothetical protein